MLAPFRRPLADRTLYAVGNWNVTIGVARWGATRSLSLAVLILPRHA